MRKLLSTLVLAGLSTACAAPVSASIDPENAVHCLALSAVVHKAALEASAPAEQVKALEVVAAWYTYRLRTFEGGRFTDRAVLTHEIEPVFGQIAQDPGSTVRQAKECADQAVADPKFGAFAEFLARR